MMGNMSEVKPKATTSRRRAETAGEERVSSPQFIFTDAASRDDLYALPSRLNGPQSARPSIAGGYDKQQVTRAEPRSAGLPSNMYSMSPRQSHQTAWRAQNSHNGYKEHSSTTIGMALGSPSQSPWLETNESIGSASSLDPSAIGSFSSAIHEQRASMKLEDANKQKGRWRMFGGLFTKKGTSTPASPAPPFYKAQYPSPSVLDRRVMTPQAHPSSRHRRVSSRSLDTIVPHRVEKKRSVRENTAKVASKPDLAQRAKSTPLVQEAARSPTPPPKDYLVHAGINKKLPSIKPMLLEVDIPDVSMERYSVMFGNVLQPRQSSLLMRRQAQLENLKVVDTATVRSCSITDEKSH